MNREANRDCAVGNPGLTAPRDQSCPVCKRHDSISALCVVDDFEILTCANCKTDFVANPPNAEDLVAYYDRPEWFEGGERGGYENYDLQTDGNLPGFESWLEKHTG